MKKNVQICSWYRKLAVSLMGVVVIVFHDFQVIILFALLVFIAFVV